jgi:Ni,Fe-hydrogenase III large subunit/NADH:ubiquinone oxidoreductase subunit C
MTEARAVTAEGRAGERSAVVEQRVRCSTRWGDAYKPEAGEVAGHDRLACPPEELQVACAWLVEDEAYAFATLVAEEGPDGGITLTYIFYKDHVSPWIDAVVQLAPTDLAIGSVSRYAHAADWHEREVADLFGVGFEGHPRLGEFVLHENWPEGVNPMRGTFDARRELDHSENEKAWEPPTVVSAPGAFAMPIGPVFADFAESALFLLETVGEDVIHTIPRFFYKYRGVEKIAEGRDTGRVLLLAERFSGTSAFAHGLGFCQAVEAIGRITVPIRARVLRTVFAELERLRHHAGAVAAICGSTALAVANSQAALIEEELLRLSGAVCGHRYLFGLVTPGGVTRDLSDDHLGALKAAVASAAGKLQKLHDMLRVSSSFLDRLEEVGVISNETAVTYGLVGPVARASGLSRDMRVILPYAAYDTLKPVVPTETEGDGYARLRILFQEAVRSAELIQDGLRALPPGPVHTSPGDLPRGVAFSAVEAPLGAAFHWVRLGDGGVLRRYRITPPSFANLHAFSRAAENFAFQDFPIILASFGQSHAECDR